MCSAANLLCRKGWCTDRAILKGLGLRAPCRLGMMSICKPMSLLPCAQDGAAGDAAEGGGNAQGACPRPQRSRSAEAEDAAVMSGAPRARLPRWAASPFPGVLPKG